MLAKEAIPHKFTAISGDPICYACIANDIVAKGYLKQPHILRSMLQFACQSYLA